MRTHENHGLELTIRHMLGARREADRDRREGQLVELLGGRWSYNILGASVMAFGPSASDRHVTPRPTHFKVPELESVLTKT